MHPGNKYYHTDSTPSRGWFTRLIRMDTERRPIRTPGDIPQEGIVRPIKRRTDPDLDPDALLVIIQSDLEYLLELTQSRKRATYDMGYFKLHQVERPQGGGTYSFTGPFLGAPHAVMGLEKMIALGAKRIWVLGWCGSLQPRVRIGDLVLPTHSFSEEGTSSHYPIGSREPGTDHQLTDRLEAWLLERGVPYRKGAVWTTDAPYRETPCKVTEYQARGALAVEMEMSALITLGVYRSVGLAGLLVVSDELFDLKWRPGFKNPLFKEACRSASEALLKLVESEDGSRPGGC